MKALNVYIPSCISRALEARYDVPKLQSALDADYNNDNDKDHLAVNTKDSGIKSAKVKEGKTDGARGEFTAVEMHKIERSGIVNDPRRMTAWLVNFTKFIKANGEPSGELTPDVLPANLVLWLDRKFVKAEIAESEKAELKKNPPSVGGHRGRNGKPAVQSVA